MILPEVRREERIRFAYAAGAFMCVASAALVARTVGDTVYLTRFGSNRLALMYVGTAVIIAALSLTYATVAANWSIVRAISVASVLLIAGCIAVRFGLATESGPVRVATYFFAEIIIRLPALLFWTYVTLIFNPREAKRLVGLIGAGGTVACIAAGALIPRFVRAWGTANLLWLVAALLAAFVILVRRAGDGSSVAPARAGTKSTVRTGANVAYYAGLLRRDQVRVLTGLVALASFALVVNDFVFKSAARANFAGQDLAAFFGGFYSIASIAALVLQLFVVHQVLARGGLGLALRILPVALLVTSAAVLVTGTFGSIVAAKFVEPFLDFTINAAAIQMLYLGIAKQSRQQVRALLDGVVRPLAIAVAGGTILSLTGLLPLRALAGLIVVVCCAWIWIAKKNHLAYTKGLRESIGAHRFDVTSDVTGLSDPAVTAHVRDALRTSPDEDIPYILSLATYWSDTDWTPEYRMLLDRANADVKIRALEYLAAHGDDSDVERVERELGSTDPHVRRVAVIAVSRLVRPQPAQLLWDRVHNDADPRVRAAAAAELINHGDLDDLIGAATTFRNMLGSSEKDERVAAAHSITLLARESFTSSLRVLLEDTDTEVQLIALDGVRAQPADSLIAPVVQLVRDPRVGWKAAQTLVSFGPRALPSLRELVAESAASESPPRFAYVLPGVLAQIEGGTSLLASMIDATDLQLRHVAIRSFCEAVRRLSSTTSDEPTDRIVEREISRAGRARDARASLGGTTAELLVHALSDEHRLHVDALLHLLQLQNPAIEPAALLDTLLSGERRAEAVELLDNLLPARWKALVLAILEPPREREADVAGSLRSLIEERWSPWVMIGAIHAAGDLGLSELAPAIAAVAHADGILEPIRETAAAALLKLDDRTKLRQTQEG